MKKSNEKKSREGEDNRGIPKGSTSGLPSDGFRNPYVSNEYSKRKFQRHDGNVARMNSGGNDSNISQRFSLKSIPSKGKRRKPLNSGNVDKNTKSNPKIPLTDGDKVEVAEIKLPENHTETREEFLQRRRNSDENEDDDDGDSEGAGGIDSNNSQQPDDSKNDGGNDSNISQNSVGGNDSNISQLPDDSKVDGGVGSSDSHLPVHPQKSNSQQTYQGNPREQGRNTQSQGRDRLRSVGSTKDRGENKKKQYGKEKDEFFRWRESRNYNKPAYSGESRGTTINLPTPAMKKLSILCPISSRTTNKTSG